MAQVSYRRTLRHLRIGRGMRRCAPKMAGPHGPASLRRRADVERAAHCDSGCERGTRINETADEQWRHEKAHISQVDYIIGSFLSG